MNKITDKPVVETPGNNAHILLTQDVTVNGETVQDVRQIETGDLKALFVDVATLEEAKAYLGIS